MAAFAYQALDAKGRLRKGVLEGDSARQVRQQLREQGLAPLELEAVKQREQRQGGRRLLRPRISPRDLALLTRQLATLVQSGTPLEEALSAVARQSEGARLQHLMLAVRARVMEGHSLAQGLADFPQVFPDLYRATVAAGEQSGHLDKVLERLADYTESRQQLRQKVQLALFYPIILTLVALLVVIALLAYVVPEVVQVFDSINQQLPAMTLGLIALSDFLKTYYPILLAALLFGSLAVRGLLKRPGPRYGFDLLLLRLPLLSALVKGLQTARFTRTLSILSGSGVPILEALRIAAAVLSNQPMRQAVESAALRVREGGGISKALEASGYFPPIAIHLIASGEASGRLEQMLERAAQNQEREMEGRIALVMGLFEPLLILTMGMVVLAIVLAILLPIFELNQLVR